MKKQTLLFLFLALFLFQSVNVQAIVPASEKAMKEKPTFFVCQGLKGPAKDACFNEQMKKFLLQNLIYPSKAQNNDIEGKILVEFIIDSNGNVSAVKPLMVRNPNNPDLQKEALRVIGKLPKMKPGKQGKEYVNVRYTIPITFKLPN